MNANVILYHEGEKTYSYWTGQDYVSDDSPTLISGPILITPDTDLSTVRLEFSEDEIAHVFDSVLYDVSGVVVHQTVALVIVLRVLETP